MKRGKLSSVTYPGHHGSNHQRDCLKVKIAALPISKGRLVKGPYKPICRDCAIYLSTTVSEKRKEKKTTHHEVSLFRWLFSGMLLHRRFIWSFSVGSWTFTFTMLNKQSQVARRFRPRHISEGRSEGGRWCWMAECCSSFFEPHRKYSIIGYYRHMFLTPDTSLLHILKGGKYCLQLF